MTQLWAPAIDRWHNQTGTVHLTKIVKHRGYDVVWTACGSDPYTLGGSSTDRNAFGGTPCALCVRIANRDSNKKGIG